VEKTLSAKNQTKPSHPKLKNGPDGILLYIEEAGAKGLLPLSPAPQIPAEPASASLRTIALDDSEHFLHNHHASVATLRLLFTFAPECRSASLRNRCSPSPEYPLEDKIVQKAAVDLLNAIYEQDFLDCCVLQEYTDKEVMMT